jgi:hypothetical protein
LESLKERDHSEDLDIDRRILLIWTLGEIGCRGMDWIHLAQDRDNWWAPENTVLNLWVP